MSLTDILSQSCKFKSELLLRSEDSGEEKGVGSSPYFSLDTKFVAVNIDPN